MTLTTIVVTIVPYCDKQIKKNNSLVLLLIRYFMLKSSRFSNDVRELSSLIFLVSAIIFREHFWPILTWTDKLILDFRQIPIDISGYDSIRIRKLYLRKQVFILKTNLMYRVVHVLWLFIIIFDSPDLLSTWSTWQADFLRKVLHFRLLNVTSQTWDTNYCTLLFMSCSIK